VSTLIDMLNQAGMTLKERAPKLHKQLVIHVLNMNRDKGITARGIEHTLKQIADLEIERKYNQSKYRLYDHETLRKEKERDYQLLTLSTPRIIEILDELEKNGKVVTKTVIAKNYHIYKPRRPTDEVWSYWSMQSLLACHYLMTMPVSNNKEERLEECIQRIGVFAMSVFLDASRDFGLNLPKDKMAEIQFDYVYENVNPLFIYNKILRFFIPRDQQSISQDDFDYLKSLLRKKYPQYTDKILEGYREAERTFRK
jgi:hypothetical protein